PTAPGVYRFFLVVAAGGMISEPDEIRVVVMAELPQTAPIRAPSSPPSIEDLVREGLAMLPGGRARAVSLADAFDGVIGRMNLYESYNEVQREVALRL